MTLCRLLVDSPADGAWNMAVDEVLLDEAAHRGVATLRLYQWREPTLSLGYFQPYADRGTHAASRAAPTVRRLSGGGALLHDRELTYSFCIPGDGQLSTGPDELYRLVHDAIGAALGDLGVAACLRADAPTRMAPLVDGDEPFLCFLRPSATDVVTPASDSSAWPPAKIVGSAQRRRGGAVLQHGAILLAASEQAPELPGIAEITGIFLPAPQLGEVLTQRLGAAADLCLREDGLTRESLDAAEHLKIRRYGADRWTQRR